MESVMVSKYFAELICSNGTLLEFTFKVIGRSGLLKNFFKNLFENIFIHFVFFHENSLDYRLEMPGSKEVSH